VGEAGEGLLVVELMPVLLTCFSGCGEHGCWVLLLLVTLLLGCSGDQGDAVLQPWQQQSAMLSAWPQMHCR
jgi:hypothetical protein